ncbi:MAG: FHA domain-containing protein [Deltaproteobacteria bacterium]|nr:FHA domain-containing protein [Deltaproteobacteria bacterium]
MIICPSCKQENADDYIYCLFCGTELKGVHPAEVAVPLTNIKKRPAPAAPSVPPQPAPVVPGGSWDQAIPGSVQQFSQPAAMVTEPPAPAFVSEPPVSAPPSPAPQPYELTPRLQPAAAPVSQPPFATAPAAEKHCPKCANVIPANFMFCGHCGFRFAETAAPEAARGKTIFMHAPVVEAPPKPIVRLVVVNPDGSDGATFTLSAREMMLGRSKGLMLFPDDKFISPLHARFTLDEGSVLRVIDEKSLNGVYVRIKAERPLAAGDLIRLGRQLLRFDAAAAIEEIQQVRSQGDDSIVLGSPVTGYWGRLVQVLEGARIGDVHLLVEHEITVGREKGEIVFPMDGFMSAQHAKVIFRNGGCFIKDLGSANKTYVRIRDSETLAVGDVLLIGNKLIKIDIR